MSEEEMECKVIASLMIMLDDNFSNEAKRKAMEDVKKTFEKQQKVIDKMAEYIRVKTDFTTIGNIKAIKEHFYRKVEENE